MIGEIEHGQKASALAVRQRLMQAKAPTFRDRIVAINRRIQDVTERNPEEHRKLRFIATMTDTSLNTHTVRWRKIMSEVAKKHNMSVIEMTGRQRSTKHVNARYELWNRLRTETRMSLPEIGRRTGRDHTSVLAGLRRYAERTAP